MKQLSITSSTSTNQTVRISFRASLLNPAWRDGLLIFLATRIYASVVALLIPFLHIPPLNPAVTSVPHDVPQFKEGLQGLLFGVWEKWDVFWYLHLAQNGYSATEPGIVYQPFFPFLIYILRTVGLNEIIAAFLISNVCFLISLVYIIKLTSTYLSYALSCYTAVLVAFSPFSFFFLVPYTEATLLMTSVLCLYLATHQRWALAALFGILATMTKVSGLVLFGALAIVLLLQDIWPAYKQAHLRTGESLPEWRSMRLWPGACSKLLLICFIPLAEGFWLAYRYFILKNYVDTVGYGGDGYNAPWTGFINGFFYLFKPQSWVVMGLIELIIFVGFGILTALCLRKVPLLLATYTLLLYIAITLHSNWYIGPLINAPRHTLLLFPAFSVLAGLLRTRLAKILFLSICLILYAAIAGIFSLGYLVG